MHRKNFNAKSMFLKFTVSAAFILLLLFLLFLYPNSAYAVSFETVQDLWVNGNAGIGTTAPLGLLQVGTSPNAPLLVTAAGSVGIGTTNPGSTLDVIGFGRFTSPNAGTTGAVVVRDASGNPNVAYLQFTNNATSAQYGYIQGLSGTGLALMGGNVGIGSTSPNQKLYVEGSVNIPSGQNYKINNVNLSAANVGAEPTLSKSNLTGTSPISVSNAPQIIGASASAITIANAVANGSTKGAAAFTASDFDDASGVISIDYANAQAATGNNKGFLTATDFNTFNGKLSVSGTLTGLVRSTASGSNYFTGGNVGIGMSTPGAPLELSRAITNAHWDVVKIDNVGSWGGALNKHANILFTDGTNKIAAIGTTYDGTYGRVDFHSFYPVQSEDTVVLSVRGDNRVGIGTTNPTQALEVNGNAYVSSNVYTNSFIDSGNSNYYLDPNNTGNSLLVAGNVGIGTTGPGAKLHVLNGDSSFALFGPNTSWAGKLYVGAGTNQAAAATAQVISTDGNLHLDPAPSKNIYLGYYQTRDIQVYGNIVMATGSATVDGRDVSADGSKLDGITAGAADTTNDTWSGTGNVTMTSGNVGIGTASPQNKLHVEKARSDTISSAAAAYRLGGTDVYLFGGSKSSGSYAVWMQAFRPSDDVAFPLALNPNGGNVGIGTTGPGAKLDVQGGNINTSGTVTASGGGSGNWNTAYTHSQAVTGAEHGATSAVTVNMIVRRDANGYIFGNYFNSTDDVNTGTLTYLMGKFGDNYYRSATAAKVQTFLGLSTSNAPQFAGLTLTGALNLSQTYIEMDRDGGARNGISWYSPSYTSWSQYMSPAGQTSTGPHGDLTAPSGTLVTSWGLRSFIENGSGYGWTFESGTSSGQPSVVAEIRSSDGSIRSAGNIIAAGSVGIGTTAPRSKFDTWTGTMTGAANDYEKAQFTMSGGGTITWAGGGGRLKWTARFIAIPVQRTTTASAGYIDINQPTTDIPAGQCFDGLARSATADGVLLNAWEGLYAAHTVGGNNAAITYYIVKYTTDFNPPSNWLLVAAINGDNNTAKLGTGVTLKSGGSWIAGTDAQYLTAEADTLATVTGRGASTSTAVTLSGGANFPGSGIWNSSGNVGIGTTNPGYKLDIQGGDVRVGAPTINWSSGNPDVFVQGNLEIDATAYMDGPLVIGTSGMETTGNINTRKTTGYNYFMSSVGIGNSSPGQKLDITAGNGRVDSGYSWLTNSDIRFKKNITTLKDSLKKVLAIRGVRYDLIGAKELKEGEGKHIGFVAQELKEEFPELVVTDQKGDNAVDYDKMTAVLVEAIKEQQSQIAGLRSEISQLKVEFKAR